MKTNEQIIKEAIADMEKREMGEYQKRAALRKQEIDIMKHAILSVFPLAIYQGATNNNFTLAGFDCYADRSSIGEWRLIVNDTRVYSMDDFARLMRRMQTKKDKPPSLFQKLKKLIKL